MLGAVTLLAVLFGVGVSAASDLRPFLVGELADLVLLEQPISLAAHQVIAEDGRVLTLGDKRGKVLLVNLWQKGCAPCRAEMRDFAALQDDLGTDRFEVVALPMEKRKARSARKILDSWGASSLAAFENDPSALAGVLFKQGFLTERPAYFAYPTTYLINRKGEMVATREGFMHWDTKEVRALLRALLAEE